MSIKLDTTITFGNILVALSLAVAILFSWSQMGYRLTNVEIGQQEQRQIIASQAETIRLLSLNVAGLSKLAEIYVPRIEELSRETRERKTK